MVEVLQNKNLATRFQILVEIAAMQPNIQQRHIAKKLNITPQAVSDYVKRMLADGLLTSDGRSRYRVSNEGVNWIIKVLRELRAYSSFARSAITGSSVCAALADCDLIGGQAVGLEMKDGRLFATRRIDRGARGRVVADVKQGEDAGITDIEGIVPVATGRVTILSMPGIQKGGSRKVDFKLLDSELKDRAFIGALGIEAQVVLRKAGVRFSLYGAAEAAVEAAQSGLRPLLLCVDDEMSRLVKRLEEENIGYELINIEKG